MLLPAVLRAGAFFSLESAAEFYVPLMRASGAAKRSRPLFARSSSAIVRRSGTVWRCRKTVSDKGRLEFQGRIEAYARFIGHARAPSRKTPDTMQRSKFAKRSRRDFRNKNNKRFNTNKRVKPSQSGKRFSKTRLARISGVSAYKKRRQAV